MQRPPSLTPRRVATSSLSDFVFDLHDSDDLDDHDDHDDSGHKTPLEMSTRRPSRVQWRVDNRRRHSPSTATSVVARRPRRRFSTRCANQTNSYEYVGVVDSLETRPDHTPDHFTALDGTRLTSSLAHLLVLLVECRRTITLKTMRSSNVGES